MADQQGYFPKAVMGQAGADIIQHVIVGGGLEGDGAAEVFVLCAEPDGDDGKDEHGKIRILGFQLLFQIAGHGLGDDVVRAQGRLVAVLLQSTQWDEDNGLLPVYLLHFQSG